MLLIAIATAPGTVAPTKKKPADMAIVPSHVAARQKEIGASVRHHRQLLAWVRAGKEEAREIHDEPRTETCPHSGWASLTISAAASRTGVTTEMPLKAVADAPGNTTACQKELAVSV